MARENNGEFMRSDEYGPHVEFCVSEFRQTQEYHVINVHDGGLFPLSTALPVG